MTTGEQNKPASKAAEAIGTIRRELFEFGKTHPGFAVLSESFPGGGSEITTTMTDSPHITVSARGAIKLNGRPQESAEVALAGARKQIVLLGMPARNANRPSGPR